MSRDVSAPVSIIETDGPGNVYYSAQNFATGQISVLNTATTIAAARPTRRAISIVNRDVTNTVFIGLSTVTTATGYALPPLGAISIPTTAAITGITASASINVSFIEVFDTP
jgi:hypothetical protein